MAGGRSSRHKVDIAEKRQKCLKLRRFGASFRQIAEQQGISLGQAHTYVSEALAEINSLTATDAKQLRELELERLDIATLAIAEHVRQGHLGAIDRWLKIAERRAKLLGLDAVVEQRVTLETEKQLTQTLDALKQRMEPNVFEQLIAALVAINDCSEVPE
jgi:DNA-binding CsgD family transcriptional regulator